ncbi:MAG: hypothetical protein V3V59_04145, partial [Thermodesulfovibrionales bacterium]
MKNVFIAVSVIALMVFSPVYSDAFICVDGSISNLADDFQTALDDAELGLDSEIRLVVSATTYNIADKTIP